VAGEDGAVGSDDDGFLLAVNAERFPEQRELTIRVAAVVPGVGAEIRDPAEFGDDPRWRVLAAGP
jgi:hypothetical protein